MMDLITLGELFMPTTRNPRQQKTALLSLRRQKPDGATPGCLWLKRTEKTNLKKQSCRLGKLILLPTQSICRSLAAVAGLPSMLPLPQQQLAS